MSAAMSVGQGIFAMISNYTNAIAAEKAAQANADAARREGRSALYAAQEKTMEVSRSQRKMWGAQEAVVGGAGLALTGSPLSEMIDTQSEYEQKIQQYGYAAHVALASKEFEARVFEMQKNEAHRASVMALWAGPFNSPGSGAAIGGMVNSAMKGGSAWDILNGQAPAGGTGGTTLSGASGGSGGSGVAEGLM